MKIMYLNVFIGCQEKDRFLMLCEFIRKENPDVLGMSELNEWDARDFDKMKQFQRLTNLPYAHFCKSPSDFSIGLFSKMKFASAQSITEGFHTGLLKAKVKYRDFTFLVTHLDYRSEDSRLQEVELIKSRVDSNAPVILMGDMNSLSPQDPYEDAKLLAQLRTIGLTKFGTTRLRKEVITSILNFGFVDAVKEKCEDFEHSVPAAFNSDEAHFAKLRLDYIFATKNVNIKSAGIIRTSVTNKISDHFPVIAEVN